MYKVIVGAGTNIQGALHTLEKEVNAEMEAGWEPSGGVSLTLSNPRVTAGFELRDGMVFIYSQGMVKHEAHSDGTNASGHRVGSSEG